MKEDSPPWGRRSRAGHWVHLFLSLLLLAAILVGVNILARAHYVRKDLTSDRSFELSDFTVKVLRALDREVTIYLVGPGPREAADRSLGPVWQRIQILCDELKKWSPRIRIKTVTESDPSAIEELKRHFKVPVANSIYFVSRRGANHSVHKALQVQPGRFYTGNPATGKVENFWGERWLVAGIRAVSLDRKRVVYSVIGHDETTPSTGLGLLKTFLEEREGIELRPLVLRDVTEIPKDATCLLIAGPRHPLAPAELQVLRRYLQEGGSVFLALLPGREAGLTEFLAEWGLKHGPGYVCDVVEKFYGDPKFILSRRFGEHPINAGLQNLNSSFTLPDVSVVEKTEKAPPGRTVQYLFFSGPDSWEETGPEGQARPRPTENERRGEMPLGAAVSVDLNSSGAKKARLVMWGSAQALTDRNFAYLGRPNVANLEYVLNHLRWLMGKEEQIAIPPKRPGQRPMDLTPSALDRIKWVTLLGFPALGILVGILAWFVRRK